MGKLFRNWRGVRSPHQIAFNRLVDYYHEQWKIARTAVDWVVALYLIVPGFIAVGIIYTSMWQHPPIWFSSIPFNWMVLILYLFTLSSRLRTLLERADQVFLLQNNRWIQHIRRFGASYSIIFSILTVSLLFTLLFTLLSPLLVIQYGWNTPWIAILAFYTFMWRWATPILKPHYS